jgi:hypothetical protein
MTEEYRDTEVAPVEDMMMVWSGLITAKGGAQSEFEMRELVTSVVNVQKLAGIIAKCEQFTLDIWLPFSHNQKVQILTGIFMANVGVDVH